MNRKQKIELLKGIVKGSRSITELEPQTFEIWFVSENTCKNVKTGQILSRAEYDSKYLKEKTINVTLLIE
jgi:hypothetical protein